MPTLYIHIGHEKTGTTTLQQFFHANRDLLLTNEILYPEIGYQKFVQSGLVNSIHDLDNGSYMEFFPNGVDENPDLIWGELKSAAQEWGKDILISSEHFVSRLKVKGIQYMKKYIEKNMPTYKVKIIIVLRRQDEMLSSRLSTLIKAGAKEPLEHWEEEILNKKYFYDYKGILNLWSEVFGSENISVIGYHKSLNIIDRFIDLLNLNGTFKLREKKFNQSLQPLTVALGFKLNKFKHEIATIDRSKMLSLIDDFVLENELNTISSKLISYKMAKNIIKIYCNDNHEIEEKYLKGNILFNNELSESLFFGDVSQVPEELIMRTLSLVCNEIN